MESTPTSVRTGIWLFPAASASELVAAVVSADAAGVDEVWIADEGVSREPVPLFAAAVASTARILMGIGITSPALRHPGAMASSVATLDELSEGRAILGFGVGGGMSLDPFGITVAKPVALVRDAIRTARDVFERQESERYVPPWHASPARTVPIFVGAKGEQLNRLASREADGVFLSGFDLSKIGVAVEWARSVRPVHVALYASVCFTADRADDPTVLCGDPATVAAGMVALVERHRPETIGLALVDGDPVGDMTARAVEAIRIFRSSTGAH